MSALLQHRLMRFNADAPDYVARAVRAPATIGRADEITFVTAYQAGEGVYSPDALGGAGSQRPSWTQTARATPARSSGVSAPSRLSSRCLLAVAIWSAMAFRRSPATMMKASAG